MTIAILGGAPSATDRLHLGDGKIYYKLGNGCPAGSQVRLSLFSEGGNLLCEMGGVAQSDRLDLGKLDYGTYVLMVNEPALKTKLTFSVE